MRRFEPHWGIDIAVVGVYFTGLGVAIALVSIMVELEDRQAERIFRAWQVMLAVPAGSSQREAAEYLNREFDGFVCRSWVNSLSIRLTGNNRRSCIIPKKEESPQMRVGSGGASSMPPQQRNSIEINAPGEWKP